MIRFLFLRVILPLLILWFLRRILQSIFGRLNSSVSKSSSRPAPPVQTGGELKKDPVCGTYVSTEASVTKRINGETLHFCSAACRDKYRAA